MNTRIVYVLQMLISNGQLEKLLFLQFYIYYTYNFENENSAKVKNVKIIRLTLSYALLIFSYEKKWSSMFELSFFLLSHK